MKKTVFVLILVVLLAATLCGCDRQSDTVSAEGHDWAFYMLQESADGEIVRCCESLSQMYPDATVWDYECNVENGTLEIKEKATSLILSYEQDGDGNSVATNYRITDEGGNEGLMVASITAYASGKEEYTLIVSFGGNVYYFKSAK